MTDFKLIERRKFSISNCGGISISFYIVSKLQLVENDKKKTPFVLMQQKRVKVFTDLKMIKKTVESRKFKL